MQGSEGDVDTIISEPKKDGSAALIVQVLGTATLEDNDAARRTWTMTVDRFAASHGRAGR
ncbi:MAG TPA: hypothetical protein VFO05_16255 [Candidatus Limnocylindrales bacterium]|nr:hypothetical protein [Candidatus Limnocylindrales bacterium]